MQLIRNLLHGFNKLMAKTKIILIFIFLRLFVWIEACVDAEKCFYHWCSYFSFTHCVCAGFFASNFIKPDIRRRYTTYLTLLTKQKYKSQDYRKYAGCSPGSLQLQHNKYFQPNRPNVSWAAHKFIFHVINIRYQRVTVNRSRCGNHRFLHIYCIWSMKCNNC